MLVKFIYLFLSLYATFIIFIQLKLVNAHSAPSSCYFLHHSNAVRWVGLGESDWPKIVQLAFRLKAELKLPVSYWISLVPYPVDHELRLQFFLLHAT